MTTNYTWVLAYSYLTHPMKRHAVYSEYYDQTDTLTIVDEFSQGYYDEYSGRGWSGTIGAIYRPINNLRIGLSIRTPELQNFKYVFESDNITVANDTAYEVKSPYIFRISISD